MITGPNIDKFNLTELAKLRIEFLKNVKCLNYSEEIPTIDYY